MKPIEPGCLCLAYCPELVEPQFCVAVKYIEKDGETYPLMQAKMDLWQVDRHLMLRRYEPEPYCDARYIMRIDGHEDEHDTETCRENEGVSA